MVRPTGLEPIGRCSWIVHKNPCQGSISGVIWSILMRRGGRVVEGARLESVYMPKAYQGFESLSLRHIVIFPRPLLSKNPLIDKDIWIFSSKFVQRCLFTSA